MENIPNEIGPSPLLTFSQCPIFWLKSTSSKESLHSGWQLVHRAALFCIVKRGVPLNQGEGLTTKDVALFTPFIDYFVQQLHLTLIYICLVSKTKQSNRISEKLDILLWPSCTYRCINPPQIMWENENIWMKKCQCRKIPNVNKTLFV